jgi:hypothetical protein
LAGPRRRPEWGARWLAVAQAQAIVSGTVPPLQGANALWGVWHDTNDEELKVALVEFLMEQESWELATPEARPGVEREIMERARAFIDRWTPGGE